jgi:hypothetical protein
MQICPIQDAETSMPRWYGGTAQPVAVAGPSFLERERVSPRRRRVLVQKEKCVLLSKQGRSQDRHSVKDRQMSERVFQLSPHTVGNWTE